MVCTPCLGNKYVGVREMITDLTAVLGQIAVSPHQIIQSAPRYVHSLLYFN